MREFFGQANVAPALRGPALDAFAKHWLRGAPFPVALAGGWQLISLKPGQSAQSVDLVVTHAGTGRIVASVFPVKEARQCFKATKLLGVSYYPNDRIPGRALAKVVEEVAALLGANESSIDPKAVAEVFGDE